MNSFKYFDDIYQLFSSIRSKHKKGERPKGAAAKHQCRKGERCQFIFHKSIYFNHLIILNTGILTFELYLYIKSFEFCNKNLFILLCFQIVSSFLNLCFDGFYNLCNYNCFNRYLIFLKLVVKFFVNIFIYIFEFENNFFIMYYSIYIYIIES